jgi:hypothetical protein
MKVGTIVKLKVECMGNEIGARGVVFNDYGDGSQVIFESGDYDGFNETVLHDWSDDVKLTEKDFFLEVIGFSDEVAGYNFKNVIQVSQDYSRGLFDPAFKKEIA